jgi:hypothetical protein
MDALQRKDISTDSLLAMGRFARVPQIPTDNTS